MLNLDPYGDRPRQCFVPLGISMEAMVEYAIKLIKNDRESCVLVHSHGYAVMQCNSDCKSITQSGSQSLTQPTA